MRAADRTGGSDTMRYAFLIVDRGTARWDRAWEQAGPDWGRTGTGS